MSFYERYAALCAERGLSAQSREMFDVAGVTTGTISGWKRGAEPRPAVLVRLARYFGVSVDYLLGLTEVRTSELTDHERLIVEAFRKADAAGQQEIICVCQNEKHRAERSKAEQPVNCQIENSGHGAL